MTEHSSIRLSGPRLDRGLDDQTALDTLRRFYRDESDRLLGALARKEISPGAFRLSLTQVAEIVLCSVCDRISSESGFADITVSMIALRQFAECLVNDGSSWPVLAIYELKPGSNRPDSRTTCQQTAERMLDRICSWIDQITHGRAALSWPLKIESLPVFSNRITHSRTWLDALPYQATAIHAPILAGARCVAGDRSLGSQFIEEAHGALISPFRTQLDLDYLAGYFGAAVRQLRSIGDRSSEAPVDCSAEAIDALIALKEVERLGSSANSKAFHESIQVSLDAWLQRSLLAQVGEAFADEGLCRLAEAWFEETFATPVQAASLAQAILVGNLSEEPAGLSSIFNCFDSSADAWRMLHELASEEIPVLSSRKCRYHFSRIVFSLLTQISKTPSPDLTLRNIVHTGRCLGAKGVLWELFSSQVLFMELYTRLCGTSPYLVQILLSSPGMIDDLFDSLMLERIPDYTGFQAALDSLCKGSSQIESVVLSFKNAMHLAIGVRDILGLESITEIHRALADVHEVCLRKLAQEAYRSVAAKYPEPRDANRKLVDYGILVVGKLASREPNYHSDISFLVLYDSDQTIHGTYFQQVAQKLIQMANRVTRFGRLFELRAWQFQGGRSSGLAWTTDQLFDSIQHSELQIEERMNLYTARVVGEDPFAAFAESAIERFLHQQDWTNELSFDLVQWRRGLEQTATADNIKRGWGGTLDVEVLAHLFFAKHLMTPKHPWLRGTVERLEALRRNGVLSPQDALQLRDAYYFLRGVESGLRLMNTKLRHDLPREESELSKLAYVLQSPDTEQLLESCNHYRHAIEELSQRHYAQIRAQAMAFGDR